MGIYNAIVRIKLLVETADRMSLEAKQRGFYKMAEEYEIKRNTLEGALKILKEEEKEAVIK